MAYNGHNWVNDGAPAINATNLNEIDNELVLLDAGQTKLEQAVDTAYIESDITANFKNNYYINLGGGVGTTVDINNPTYNVGFRYLLQPCKKGDSLTITALGGNASRAWGILDTNAKILAVANANASVQNLTITASQDGYFVVNHNKASILTLKAIYKTSRVDIMAEDISAIQNNITVLKDITDLYINNYFIDLSVGIGNVVDINNPTWNVGFAYYLIPCKSGEQITVTTKGGSSSRAWGILDTNVKLLSVADANVIVQNLVLTANQDGYFVVNSNNATPQYRTVLYKTYSSDSLDAEINKEKLNLPDNIYGVVGVETNVYYENALQYGVMDTTARMDTDGIDEAERYAKRLIWKPTTRGVKQAKIKMYKHNIEIPVETADINFVAANSGDIANAIKCLVIGDSKIAYGQIVGMMRDLFGASLLNLIGTRYDNNDSGDQTLRHEGRAGWSAGMYISSASATVGGLTLQNPFYNANYTNPTYGGHFDFATYCSNQGYSNIDYVVINLGTNDFGVSAATYVNRIWAMVSNIHSYDGNIKIILGLFEGVYMPKLEWATRNAAFHEFRRALNNAFKNISYVYLNPQYLSMDLYEDYNLTEIPLSYADELYDTGKTRKYTADGIHQNRVGFYKNAVSIYSIIKCIEDGLA